MEKLSNLLNFIHIFFQIVLVQHNLKLKNFIFNKYMKTKNLITKIRNITKKIEIQSLI